MKYCDRCDATYSDRISFCFKDGSALFARRSALDLPSLDGPLGSAPAATETDSQSLFLRAQTTEEFLQVPIRRAGIEPINPLIEPPPPAWNEPNLAPAPTDPIGSMSFDDASGFFNESPTSPDTTPTVPVRRVKKTPKKRTKLPVGLLGGVGLVVLAAGLVIALTSNNTGGPDISLEEVLVAQPNEPIDAPTPTPTPVEAAAPVADVVMDTASLDDATEALPENVLDDENLALESEQEAPIISTTAPEQTTPTSKPKTINKTRKTTKKRPRNVVKNKAVAAPVVTEDNPWGASDSTIIATAGSLSITSTPSGATIWIDQKKRGITPLRVDLSFNTYSVRAELAGYKTRNIVVPIKSSDPTPIPFSMQALPKIGKIQVSSQEHNGKSLTMDGSSRGTLPLQIREVEEGRHTFVVDGKSTTVDITFSENLTFSLSL
jgi:hypothetical protein